MINFGVFNIKYLQFYYKRIIRTKKIKPSQYCATDGYITVIILND